MRTVERTTTAGTEYGGICYRHLVYTSGRLGSECVISQAVKSDEVAFSDLSLLYTDEKG